MTETLRMTLWHRIKHWTTPYVFLNPGRWSCCQVLRPWICGKRVRIKAFVAVVMPSRPLSNRPVLVVIFPQRNHKKWNIFFMTDLTMDPVRLLGLCAARFKIEDAFDDPPQAEKTYGGFGDCRQRSFQAQRRHVTLGQVAYHLLRLPSVAWRDAEAIEAEPWWHPSGAPSVTRLRRVLARSLRIPFSLQSDHKPTEIPALARAA